MKEDQRHPSYAIKICLWPAAILAGLLAGANIDRYFVQLPAWRYVDIRSWAEYSRHADLGNGLWLYPLEAAGSFLLLLICSILAIRNRPIPGRTARAIHLATFFSFGKLVITYFASPALMRVTRIGGDRAALQQVFDRFHFWSPYNVIVQLLCFLCCLVALMKIKTLMV